MIKYFTAILVVIALSLTAAGCQTAPSTMPDDIGNMMPEGQNTVPLLGWLEMCADPKRYEPELCPAREGVTDEPLPAEPKQ